MSKFKRRKAAKRLEARRRDFDRGETNHDTGPSRRWSSGGYHRPGSNTK